MEINIYTSENDKLSQNNNSSSKNNNSPKNNKSENNTTKNNLLQKSKNDKEKEIYYENMKNELKQKMEEKLEEECEKIIHNIILLEECENVKGLIENEDYSENSESIKNEKESKQECYIILILTIIKVLIRWIFCMINLLAIYQIINVKNALFDEIKDIIISYIFREKRSKTFYERLINESIRNFPELEIFLIFQIFSEKISNELGFLKTNLFCYIINSVILICLIFFNISIDLNKYYSIFDFFILFILFAILYFSLSVCTFGKMFQ